MSMSTLDQGQVIKTVYNKDNQSLNVTQIGGTIVDAVYDYLSLSYTDNNLTTVVYKNGGPSGTVVATLTLTYDGSNLISLTKS